MKSSIKSMPERPTLVLNPKPSQEVSCPCCNHSFLIVLQPSGKLPPLEEDKSQPGLEGFPVQRFPSLGKKAPREIPIQCKCEAFALRRRKSEPRPEDGMEVRLYHCGVCGKNVLTKEEFWRYSEKSYIEPSERYDE